MDHLEAAVPALLGDPEDRAGRVGEDPHPDEVQDIHRPGQNRLTPPGDSRGHRIDVVGGEVEDPCGGSARLHLGADAADGRAAETGHAIAADLRRALGTRIPSEEAAVEVQGGGDVGGLEVRPAGGSLGVLDRRGGTRRAVGRLAPLAPSIV